MAYRRKFYPPEIVDWYDYGRPVVAICYPICCPNPICTPRTCAPASIYATCCPNPGSISNTEVINVTGCTPDCRPSRCGPTGCNPSVCRPRYCYPRE